jgi:ATP adenylyltransferase/5',5'''-P-1,P-4-tetraphosphate phosphorylase II
MLAIAYNILRAHKAGREASPDGAGDLLAFYNCGKVSGASQPHQHMQFAELGTEDSKALPIDVLESRLPQDSKEDGE